MTNSRDSMLIRTLRDSAYVLSGAARDYDPLMDLIGDARFVLLGEASHGTHDFYDHISVGCVMSL
jgi:erythromycin esterase-like protein